MTQQSDGSYLVVEFRPDCFGPAAIASNLNYNLFCDQDPPHRALVIRRIEDNDRLPVLNPDQRMLTFSQTSGIWHTVVEFIWDDMVHFWIGYDHMLFLLALLLPAAVRRESGC